MPRIYDVPHSSQKVKFNRKLQEEREVDIYENADTVRDYHTENQSQEGGPRSERPPADAQRRTYRAAALCLGVLCILMITAIIALSIHFTLGKNELQTRYNKLNNNYSQLVSGKLCPGGWKRFGCSCYFKSDKRKTWYDSRSDCEQRGADLVVINNKEEQKFVNEFNSQGEAWIGLQATKGTSTPTGWVYEWEWVDGSLLTEMFWESGTPNHFSTQNTSAYCNQHGLWRPKQPYLLYNCICEK
ncbi:C-type lectin domain family 6 member A-like isoform X2 [Trematomus bernacchii]|uniref:C-type lectin domain family 6 member A-like isoform X2 n=1 Tax=Trematomus bernacchii TaxID=40690 RepID=UPI00146C8DCA|nr:C-type lectin domain family 6 member A-like isoform X2 [Trematomus bernacchii]